MLQNEESAEREISFQVVRERKISRALEQKILDNRQRFCQRRRNYKNMAASADGFRLSAA